MLSSLDSSVVSCSKTGFESRLGKRSCASTCFGTHREFASLLIQRHLVLAKSRTTETYSPVKSTTRRATRIQGMRIVGLTGGIASGKSTISNLFKANGIPVVDADLVARDVLKKGTGGWRKVVSAFGQEILLASGEVDRAQLGQIVFSDPSKRQVLNRLMAPYISSGIFYEVLKLWIKGSKVIVLDIPLLFEAKLDRWTKPVIVSWVDPETQLQRLMARDGISEEQARNRINAQMELDWKKGKADIVIDNSKSLQETKEQFEKVLSLITRPLSWTEFGLSRQGAFWVLASVIVGVLSFRSIYSALL